MDMEVKDNETPAIDAKSGTRKTVITVILSLLLVGIVTLWGIPHFTANSAQTSPSTPTATTGTMLLIEQVNDRPSIDNLCAVAIAVNGFGATDPESEARELRVYCTTAQSALQANDGPKCFGALQDLAHSVNHAMYSIDQLKGFTLGNFAVACHDQQTLDWLRRNNAVDTVLLTTY